MSQVDVWSLGCVLLEMFGRLPVWAGVRIKHSRIAKRAAEVKELVSRMLWFFSFWLALRPVTRIVILTFTYVWIQIAGSSPLTQKGAREALDKNLSRLLRGYEAQETIQERLMELIEACLSADPDKRPTANEVGALSLGASSRIR